MIPGYNVVDVGLARRDKACLDFVMDVIRSDIPPSVWQVDILLADADDIQVPPVREGPVLVLLGK